MANEDKVQPEGGIPPSLPGFEAITKYWDKKQGFFAAKIHPGEYYVSKHDNEMVVTVLGSCVSACIRDVRLKIGGMNHFMLPLVGKRQGHEIEGNAEKYGNFAMESLINQILSRGGRREDLEVKVTGGGRVLSIQSDVGDQNIDFVRQFAEEEGLTLSAQDLGGMCPRKVYYVPSTGRMRVKKLRETINDTISVRESAYADTLAKKPKAVASEVDLF